jgi:hypothetical protein
MRKYHAMVTHWNECGPPVYVAAAAYLGLIKKKPKKSGNLDELAQMFASTGGEIS